MKIKDYLHLYLGCYAMHNGNRVTVCGVNINSGYIQNILNHDTIPINEIKLVLRPLSDMTDSEVIACEEEMWGGFPDPITGNKKEFLKMFLSPYDIIYRVGFPVYVLAINWFRKNGFDVDGLIDAGLAIDATTLPTDKEARYGKVR